MNPLIQKSHPQIAVLCRQFGVLRLGVFGSIIRQDFDPARSDVDMVAEFEPAPIGQNLDRYLGFKAALEQLLARSVDVIEMKALHNSRLKRHIERSLVPVYAAA